MKSVMKAEMSLKAANPAMTFRKTRVTEGAGVGGEGGSVKESEHGDVSSAGDEPASEDVEEEESVVPRDEHSYEDNGNEEELRDYDDVAAEGDLPGAEQENVDDTPPQPMNIETYGLDADDVETG
ncbi:hypothetical protein PHYSODRAFT_307204 [Phytophthora sojae]|uniref:Uncharacterized protein n=1 Tax=Phytophthora sojae (strain P6497) TaxID=1094619 RepID=G5ADC5_PHYSP|nr:hypothetical protein PHYSODRAFT_307204 [Phytophthora sojae]EGZ06178.1 hypothetical protein PHYSODRAFT_307204 [Phytophthora sojae]|eukprot:XP_009538075.1 hypothetical protein PHYSODRAFT_307204 [Phytophthora sojae]